MFWLQVVYFTIYLGAIIFFARGPLREMFKGRYDGFFSAVKRAEAAKAEAEMKRKEIQDRLAKLEATRDESIQKARSDAAALRNQIVEEAKSLSSKLKADAERTAQLEVERAKYELREELLAQSVQLSKRILIVVKGQLFSDRFKYVRQYFDALEQEVILPTEQDNYLFGLCRPERLMDIIFKFILFDNGQKKVARYQQFFAIKKSMQRIKHVENGKRKGGVIWHTQGSGKSLTMVMLAQAIALESSIRNPKIVLVTDRTDLDNQITGTFRKCGRFVENATTGQRLVELLESKSDAVVTTIINKFVAAVKKISKPLESHDIVVFVDEGHRTQHGAGVLRQWKAFAAVRARSAEGAGQE